MRVLLYLRFKAWCLGVLNCFLVTMLLYFFIGSVERWKCSPLSNSPSIYILLYLLDFCIFCTNEMYIEDIKVILKFYKLYFNPLNSIRKVLIWLIIIFLIIITNVFLLTVFIVSNLHFLFFLWLVIIHVLYHLKFAILRIRIFRASFVPYLHLSVFHCLFPFLIHSLLQLRNIIWILLLPYHSFLSLSSVILLLACLFDLFCILILLVINVLLFLPFTYFFLLFFARNLLILIFIRFLRPWLDCFLSLFSFIFVPFSLLLFSLFGL